MQCTSCLEETVFQKHICNMYSSRHCYCGETAIAVWLSIPAVFEPAGAVLKEQTLGKEQTARPRPLRPLVVPQSRGRATSARCFRGGACAPQSPCIEASSQSESPRPVNPSLYRRGRGVASRRTARARAEGAGLPWQDGG